MPSAASFMKVTKAYQSGSELLSGTVSMSNQFVVFVDNGAWELGSWSKVSGLSVRWDFAEYRSTQDPNAVWRSPGLVKYTPIKLTRAACNDSNTVQQWLVDTTRQHKPQSGAIQLIDFLGTPVVNWTLKEFFPVAWEIREFDAGSSAVALETLEIVHSGFLDNEVNKTTGGMP